MAHAQVLRKLRRLPWGEHEGYVVTCMLASAKGRYTDLPLVASLAAGLSRYHPSLGVALPDALLEQVSVCCVQGIRLPVLLPDMLSLLMTLQVQDVLCSVQARLAGSRAAVKG